MQVSMLRDESYLCGGSYVLDNDGNAAVITAAHCLS